MTIDVPLTEVKVGMDAQQRVQRVLESGHIAQGPVVRELEECFAEVCGVPNCIAVTNGTIALQACLETMGIGPGDEVITSPFTFIATVNAVLAVGATVRFADVTPDYTIDPERVASLINDRTRCVIPVHLFGLPADIDALNSVTYDGRVRILEDAAQAHGAALGERPVGGLGDAATFSLYATKNLSAGEGGLITTKDDTLADRLRVLRNQGMRARYEYVGWGSNYRMTDLHAAVVVDDVYRLSEINQRRGENAAQLLAGLSGIPGLELPGVPVGRTSAWHQFTVRITADTPVGRDGFMKGLADRGVASDVFYPMALCDVPHLAADARVAPDEVPTARAMADQVVSIPVGHHLNRSQMDTVISAVKEVLGA